MPTGLLDPTTFEPQPASTERGKHGNHRCAETRRIVQRVAVAAPERYRGRDHEDLRAHEPIERRPAAAELTPGALERERRERSGRELALDLGEVRPSGASAVTPPRV